LIQDNHPEFIIIHHSASPDNPRGNDYKGICKYHTSYRYKDEIIVPDIAKKLMGAGQKVEAPWEGPCGYHYVLEYVGGYVAIHKGRDELRHGAHCSEEKMNFKSIGICVVGNYDKQAPSDEIMRYLAELCADICKRHNIPVTNIKPHREYATYKTCPGTAFPMAGLIDNVADNTKSR